MPIKLNTKYLTDQVSGEEIAAIAPKVREAQKTLYDRSGAGSEFTGWVTLPDDYDKAEFSRIQAAARRIQKNTDVFIVIGIGGSYLGARAAIEFVKSPNYNALKKDTPDIYYTGNSISPAMLNELLEICDGRDVSVNVISKSGTTTEPAIAFRVFRRLIEEKYGKEEAAKRIFVTTDREKGTLKGLADREGYETFVVPDDVGGRYSVLTAVGLLPIAVAGVEIDQLMVGAREAAGALKNPDIDQNDCLKYVAIRNILYNKGKHVELFACYEPGFAMMNEWLKQLFGESEGKDGKGIFPASVIFSTDLHSLGQYIQESGNRMFESVVSFSEAKRDYIIREEEEDIDGLNFLAGKPMSFVNEKAFQGTVLAHNDGGVPTLGVEVPGMPGFELGYLIYFFETACAVSGYVLGVNPFNQPGVESYKRNMFALLGKPGYEGEKAGLEQRLGL
ncbi:MAG: glucose-6-phosphate isomerase [Clostridiales bacterium]|nr:glucose-6-phosphate isomerase [Clostridiales bacterium]